MTARGVVVMEPIRPIRMNVNDAAARIGSISANYIRNRLIPLGIFTAIRPSGYGKGKRVYLLTDEVEAYALGGEQAVRDVQARNRRKK